MHTPNHIHICVVHKAKSRPRLDLHKKEICGIGIKQSLCKRSLHPNTQIANWKHYQINTKYI